MRKTIKLLCGCALSMAMFPTNGGAADQKFHITVLSSRPEMVSGGDALVQVAVPPDAALDQAMIRLNGQDVSAMFHPDAAAHALRGLVTGLKLGENTLAVFPDKKGRGPAAEELRLKNYPITGPIFSGPQEQPFVCETPDFKLPDGTSLGPPLDANCSVKTVVTYVYKSTDPAPATGRAGRGTGINLKPLPSLTALPADVAWTTTTTGDKVPYVVRVETGTINRAIYQIAVLHDPTTAEPGPMAPPKSWNGRLLYSFGGGCVGGWFKQGTTLGLGGGVISDAVVGKGYAEAGSTLNVAGNSCNDVIAAETMMMVKERFIKAYGKPAFTFGRGASGGSYQQNQIADNYPGLLDGIIPSMTFPDVQELTQMITRLAAAGPLLQTGRRGAHAGTEAGHRRRRRTAERDRIGSPRRTDQPHRVLPAGFGEITALRCLRQSVRGALRHLRPQHQHVWPRSGDRLCAPPD